MSQLGFLLISSLKATPAPLYVPLSEGTSHLSNGLEQAKFKFLAVDNKTGLNRRSMRAMNFSMCGRKFVWQHEISAAPFNRDLELAVIDASGEHTILFPAAALSAAGSKLPPSDELTFTPHIGANGRRLRSMQDIGA
ncbi:MAG: hypothetical protein WCD73_21425 [Pseudolabrys sp.]